MKQEYWLIAFNLACVLFLVVRGAFTVRRLIRERREVNEFKRSWLER